MMRKANSSTQRDSPQKTDTTSEATAPGSSYRSQSRFCRFLGKVQENATLMISRSKDSRSHSLVPPNANVNHERASSTSNLEDDLRFNICDLKSLYLPDNEDPGLQERVQKCISPHLSYSSQFWTLHVRVTVFDKELAKEVKMFFDHERLFFWLELLGHIKALGNAAAALPTITQWLKGHSKFKYVSSAAMDVQRFIQVFGGMILHSTPHLYVSALPFSPSNSPLSRKFSALFPNILRVAFGHDMNWPVVLTVLSGYCPSVKLVSSSPNDTRIVSGSRDRAARLWDAVIRQLSQQQSAISDPSPFSNEYRMIEALVTMSSNIWDNHSISFSPIHTPCNISELTEGASNDDHRLTPFALNVDSGWMVGLKCRLLFLVSPTSRPTFWDR